MKPAPHMQVPSVCQQIALSAHKQFSVAVRIGQESERERERERSKKQKEEKEKSETKN